MTEECHVVASIKATHNKLVAGVEAMGQIQGKLLIDKLGAINTKCQCLLQEK